MTKLSRYDGENNLEVLQEGIREYIVKPANAFGLGGFVFDLEGETTQKQESEVTDHFVEDNSVVQDHVAVRPKEIELRGFVGELAGRGEEDPLTLAQDVVRKLTILDDYLPPLTRAAEFLKEGVSAERTLQSIQDDILNLWQLTKNLNPTASKQQQAYLYFSALQKQRLLVSVQTPFEFLTNMAIMEVSARQPEDSADVSDFSIRLKQIRTASSINVEFNPDKFQDRTQQQRTEVEERGKAQGKKLQSTLFEGTQAIAEQFK